MLQVRLVKPDVLYGHSDPVKLVAFSPDGRYLASADTDRQLRVWRGEDVIFERDLRAWHQRFKAVDRVRDLVFGNTPNQLFVASGETVKAYDFADDRLLWEHGRLPTFAFLITCPQSFSLGEQDHLAVAYDDGVVEIVNNGALTAWRDNDSPKQLSFLRDKQRVAGTDYLTVCVWDVVSGTKLERFRPPQKVYCLAACPRTDLIATRSLDELQIWSPGTGELLGSAPVRPGLPTIKFHPTKNYVVTGDAQGFSVLDHEGQLITREYAVGYAPLAFAFSPSGNRLAVGCSDHLVRVFPFESF